MIIYVFDYGILNLVRNRGLNDNTMYIYGPQRGYMYFVSKVKGTSLTNYEQTNSAYLHIVSIKFYAKVRIRFQRRTLNKRPKGP